MLYYRGMSGHSKWSQIKRQKSITDNKRSGIFTKLSQNISLAAKKGKDPMMNPALRAAMDAARDANMPKDNIAKAILRGTGELPGQALEEVTYEGYGPGGVAMIVKCVTDNKNRTLSFVKTALSKAGGKLTGPNSVAYLYQNNNFITKIPLNSEGEQKLDNLIAELETSDDINNIITNAER